MEVNGIKKFLYSCFRYPEARAIHRKIIFHSGPTNSGKTYHAIQKYLSAKSGVYCGPLKLLAHEIFEKSNAAVSILPNILFFLLIWGNVECSGWRERVCVVVIYYQQKVPYFIAFNLRPSSVRCTIILCKTEKEADAANWILTCHPLLRDILVLEILKCEKICVLEWVKYNIRVFHIYREMKE